MIRRGTRLAGVLIVYGAVSASWATTVLNFEDLVRMSDRIVLATVEGPSGDSVTLPNGTEIALGVKDAASGLVFTPYRIVVSECVFDAADACVPGDSEVSIPGGTLYETVDGERRLRTWEVGGAASVPLPRAGAELLLVTARRQGRHVPLNDAGARVRVDRSSASPAVRLTFGSPRFLSAAGLESARARPDAATPSTVRPSFTERVPLDELKRIVALARQVPKPTSENFDATPTGADAHVAHALRRRGARVCPGEDPRRSESTLGLGAHHGSADGADDRRRASGS